MSGGKFRSIPMNFQMVFKLIRIIAFLTNHTVDLGLATFYLVNGSY